MDCIVQFKWKREKGPVPKKSQQLYGFHKLPNKSPRVLGVFVKTEALLG